MTKNIYKRVLKKKSQDLWLQDVSVKETDSNKLQRDKSNLEFSAILRKREEEKEKVSKYSKTTDGSSIPSLQPRSSRHSYSQNDAEEKGGRKKREINGTVYRDVTGSRGKALGSIGFHHFFQKRSIKLLEAKLFLANLPSYYLQKYLVKGLHLQIFVNKLRNYQLSTEKPNTSPGSKCAT